MSMSATSVPPAAQSDMVDIDLDSLAAAYSLRPMSDAQRRRAAVSALGCTGVLLDIGGGTGAHAAFWRDDGRLPVVVDPSTAMVDKARGIRSVLVVRGRSQELPFRSDSCGLAYFHLSIHYGDWARSLDEAFRVVSPGGRVEVWTMSHEAIARSSLGTWFPRVVEIDTARFPDTPEVARHCRMKGTGVDVTTTSEPIERRVRDWQRAIRGRFVSTLQLLTDDEIEEGLARFAARHQPEDALYRYTLRLTRVSTTV